jgi:hypothetical protein
MSAPTFVSGAITLNASNVLSLTWSATGAASYIYRLNNGTTDVIAATTVASTTTAASYTIPVTSGPITYTLYVTAYAGSGGTGNSTAATPVATVFNPPATPNATVLISSGPAPYTVIYSWSANAGTTPSSYIVNLYQRVQGVTSTATSPLTPSSPNSAIFTNTVTGTTYYCTVSALSSFGTSPLATSAESSLYNPFGGPQGIQGISGSQGGQGAQGPTGPQGIQGVQGIVNISNYTAANSLLTTANVVGTITANNTLTWNGSVLSVGGAISSGAGLIASGGITALSALTGADSTTITVNTPGGNGNVNTLTVGAGLGSGNSINAAGNISANDFVATSDARLKSDISTIADALTIVKGMRGVYFTRKGETERSVGVIAQEVEAILPEVVYTGADDFKSVSYGNIVGVLIEAVKVLSERLEKMET